MLVIGHLDGTAFQQEQNSARAVKVGINWGCSGRETKGNQAEAQDQVEDRKNELEGDKGYITWGDS